MYSIAESAEMIEAKICSVMRGMRPLSVGFSMSVPWVERRVSTAVSAGSRSARPHHHSWRRKMMLVSLDVPCASAIHALNVLPLPVCP